MKLRVQAMERITPWFKQIKKKMAAEQADKPRFFVPEIYFKLKGHSEVNICYFILVLTCILFFHNLLHTLLLIAQQHTNNTTLL
jgi:hypothetical protein